MKEHRLDRPIWNALRTRQEHVAVGTKAAARFQSDIGPLAGSCDDGDEALAALASLVPADDALAVFHFGASSLHIPSPARVERTAPGVQMVLETLRPARIDAPIELLTDADGGDMLALATLTQPGPFRARTHCLGTFWGIRERGRLVAMAGERLTPPGYTEVSGVCTHPDARGRGYAGQLSHRVAERILERGEQPFLHAYAANEGAVRIYRTLGFVLRAQMTMIILRRA